MPDPAPSSSSLEQAQARLEAALGRLETRIASGGGAPSSSALDEAGRLRAALTEAETRERRLEQLAAEASAALGRAADEVRAALAAEA